MNGTLVQLHFLTRYFFLPESPTPHLIYSVKKKNYIIVYDLIDINLYFLSAIKETEVFIKIFFMLQSYKETQSWKKKYLKSSNVYNYDLQICKCFSYLKMIVYLFIKIYTTKKYSQY